MTVAVAHSSTAEGAAALAEAARHAARLGEDLAVLSILPDDPDGDVEGWRHQTRTEVDAAVAHLEDRPAYEVHLVAAGHDVPQALLDLVASTGAGVLVVGTRRRSAVGKLLLGSVVQRVILDSPVPVLSVKPVPG